MYDCAIQENRTLTYLDLRSNDITNKGLRGLTEYIRWNPVFHTVDVRGNAKISRDVVISMRRLLKSSSRTATEVRWADYGSSLESRYHSNFILAPIPSEVVALINKLLFLLHTGRQLSFGKSCFHGPKRSSTYDLSTCMLNLL